MNEIKSGIIYDKLNKNPTADWNCTYYIIYKDITRAKTIYNSKQAYKSNVCIAF